MLAACAYSGMLALYTLSVAREALAQAVIARADCGNYACVSHLFEQFVRGELCSRRLCFVSFSNRAKPSLICSAEISRLENFHRIKSALTRNQ